LSDSLRNLELLSLAAAVQGDVCGGSLPDGTRVLELPAQYYFQRNRTLPGTSGGGPVVGVDNDTAYQYFHPRFQFVLRSIQYAIPYGTYRIIFSDGRVLLLPALSVATSGTGISGRLDVSGTASQDSAGGIVIDPCDRVTMSGSGFGKVGGIVQPSILFIGVLRIFLRGGEVQPPYPSYRSVPRALFSANQNLLAPETSRGFQCYPETPQGFHDEAFWVACPSLTFSLTGDGVQPVLQGQVLLPGDADFVWRGWDYTLQFPESGFFIGPPSAAVRFRTQNGEVVSEDLVDCASCQGPAFPETVLPAGSYVSYDATLQYGNGTPGPVTLSLYLYGVRRLRQ
jgi:hypothetical protein